MTTERDIVEEAARHAAEILEYWFSNLDDTSRLDRNAEPFRTCFQRWYGKDRAIDANIKARFELTLLAATQGDRLDDVLAAFRKVPYGLLALVILLDQLHRNMYRDTPAMYAHDALALAVSMAAIREYEHDEVLPLVRRMFLYVPLMHVEDPTVQKYMLGRFDDLAARAHVRSPHNADFFEFARDSARRHVEVVGRFGRFPHRNRILKRESTPAETTYLVDHPGF